MLKNSFTQSIFTQLTKTSSFIAQSNADRISATDTLNANTFLDSVNLEIFKNISLDETKHIKKNWGIKQEIGEDTFYCHQTSLDLSATNNL